MQASLCVSSQYRRRHREFREWLFRQFVTALTPQERRGLVRWQLERLAEEPCYQRGCLKHCEGHCEPAWLLGMIEEEERRHKGG